MCGICFVCGLAEAEDLLDKQITSLENLLSHRGPDIHDKTKIAITDEITGMFSGCVLWLQGPAPTPQPIIDHHGNVLLWNGDVLAGHEIPKDRSDTSYISEQLLGKDQEGIMTFLASIKGPWSLIYYQKTTQRLYFGRDIFGRHSLVWQLPSESTQIFLVSSLSRRSENVVEVPALGLYYVDFSQVNWRSDFHLYLIPWSHREDELEDLSSLIHISNHSIETPLKNSLNKTLPSEDITEQLKLLPSSFDPEAVEALYQTLRDDIDKLLDVLKTSIQRRVDKCPQKCQWCTRSPQDCQHSRIAVLFSGGLDSAMIALLLHSCLPACESVDLLNVAFEQKTKNSQKAKNNKGSNSNSALSSSHYEVPDRISGRRCWEQLREICPERCWNFVEIDVTAEELAKERDTTISHLLAPLNSVLDDSIGCALWFGGRGQGLLNGSSYTSPARVLLCGMGADEQLAGYSRHRVRYAAGGWKALLDEVQMEVARIHTRNLGRDNRILSDHGRAPRYPYLDEDVVSLLNGLPIWRKAYLELPRGVGEKLLLRVACARLGLTTAATLPKRAIQFGSRIAKMEGAKEKGSDTCARLVEK